MTYHPVVEGFLEGLNEKAKLDIETWASQEVYLPREVSSMPGLRRSISYQKGFFEALRDPNVEVIVLMTSAQVGKTELLSTVSLYFIKEDPSRILFIQPKDDAAEEYKSERIDPVIKASPEILKHLAGYFGNKSQDQTDYLSFPGGFIDFKGAQSPTNLAGKPIRVLLMDEIDRYPGNVGGEGDPVTIAMKRTTTERSRKIILCSTPKAKDRSRIQRLFEQTDQRRRFLKCDDCGHEQFLKFNKDRVQRTREHGVCYFCEECGSQWDQATIRRLERDGVWKPTSEAKRSGWVGFHIWEGYSPFSSMAKVLEQFEGCNGDASEEQAFTNTVLGEASEGKLFQRTSLDSIKDRREKIDLNNLPHSLLCITGALDLQGDRAEVIHVGHGVEGERWLLSIERIYGDIKSPTLWSRVTSQLMRSFRHATGNTMFVEAACLDAGFQTQTVIEYVVKAREQGLNVYATLGRSGQGKPLWQTTRAIAAPSKMYALGVDEGKTDLMMSFAVETPGPGYVHVNGWMDEKTGTYHGLTDEMCEQLMAETCEITVNKFGAETREWKNLKRRRNEALDLTVYAQAAFASLGIDLAQRAELLYAEPLPMVDPAAIARQMRGER